MATKLFVRSLAYSVTDDQLQAFFATAGTVTSAKVVIDRETDRSKGFGFVEMATEEEAKAAIEQLDGKDLDGRTIFVAEARPQAPRENRSFGGGNSGGFDRNRGGNDRNQGGRRY